MKLKRMTAALLLLAMLLTCLPLSMLAADAELVEAEETVDTVPAENTDAEVTTEEPVEEAAISTQAVNASGYFYFSAEAAISLLRRLRASTATIPMAVRRMAFPLTALPIL